PARPHKAATRFSCPASRSGATKTTGADAAFPTVPTRSRRCRRKPPKPASRRLPSRSSRSAAELGGHAKLTFNSRVQTTSGETPAAEMTISQPEILDLEHIPVGLIQHSAPTCVTRGLDPRVHHSLQELFAKEDGLPGQARQ